MASVPTLPDTMADVVIGSTDAMVKYSASFSTSVFDQCDFLGGQIIKPIHTVVHLAPERADVDPVFSL